jgi:hypothetical protein
MVKLSEPYLMSRKIFPTFHIFFCFVKAGSGYISPDIYILKLKSGHNRIRLHKPEVYPFLVYLFIYLLFYLLAVFYFQVPTEGEKKSSQSSVVTVIHMEGLDKLNKVIHISSCFSLCRWVFKIFFRIMEDKFQASVF